MSGTRINDEGKKKRAEELGGYAARGAEGAAAMGVGAVAGITTLGIGKWLKSMFTPSAMRNGQSAMDKAAAAAAEQVKKNLATSATDKAVKSAVDAAVQGITDNTVKNAARKAAEEAAKDVAKRPGFWNGIKQSLGSWGTWAKIGAVAFVVGDIIWQMSRDDK